MSPGTGMARNLPCLLPGLHATYLDSPPRRWWVHMEVASCLWFELGPAQPQELRLYHQVLVCELPSLLERDPRNKRIQWLAFVGWPVSLGDRMRSSIIWEEISVKQLLFCIERSQFRWFGYLITMPPGRLPLVFWEWSTWKRPWGRPRTPGGIVNLLWPEKASKSPRWSWRLSLGRGISRFLSLTYCLCDSTAEDGDGDHFIKVL